MTTESTGQLSAQVRSLCEQDVRACYQCGKCTAGCPMAPFMDLAPNQVMRLVQIGDAAAEQRALTSAAIWRCAGCMTCTQRCPQQLDPAAVMDSLRELAERQGTIHPQARRIRAFHRAFLKTIRKTGRMGEFGLVRRYKLSSGDLLSDLPLAPVMLLKGKLPLRAHKIAGRDEIERIFQACQDFHAEVRP